MERHEIDAELAAAGAQQLLTSGSMVRLAYVGKDGTPRVIPMGFYWTGDRVVVSTAATAPKVAALTARPDVAITIDSDTPGEARSLSIRGRASVPRLPRFLQELVERTGDDGARPMPGRQSGEMT